MDPKASRETLDHSIMYIFAVALEDGKWHHIKSYTPERARRKTTVELWHKIQTFEDKEWTKKYHETDPAKKCFGGKVSIYLDNGDIITEERGVADAHPNGNKPFRRSDYINKFKTLTDGLISKQESIKFLKTIQNLKNLNFKELKKLNVEIMKKHHKKKRKIYTIF